jgi:hypothetical protein
MNPLANATQLRTRAIPAGDLAQKFRALAIKIGEALAQEFSDESGITLLVFVANTDSRTFHDGKLRPLSLIRSDISAG